MVCVFNKPRCVGEQTRGGIHLPVGRDIFVAPPDVPARKKGIFTVQGVKLTQSWNELPAGVYIVDGVKRVKR